MISSQYAYLIGTLIFFIPWAILFLLRKDYRKEMLFMSLAIGVGSIVTAYLWWTIDWWQPETITGTRVGIEDFLLGFSNGGIAAILYEAIFRKRFSEKRKVQHFNTFTICLILFFIIAFLFWGLNITSFWASTTAMILAAAFLLFTRRDLFLNALMSGFLMALVSLPIYYILIWLFPGFVHKTWLSQYLSGITITGIPVEDIVFYFLFGFIIGPFYEYWQDRRLKKF